MKKAASDIVRRMASTPCSPHCSGQIIKLPTNQTPHSKCNVENILEYCHSQLKVHHHIQVVRPWECAGGVNQLVGLLVHLLGPPGHQDVE